MTDKSKKNTSTGRSTEKIHAPLLGSLLSKEIARKLIDRSFRDLCLENESKKALEFFTSDDLLKHCEDADIDAVWVKDSALDMVRRSMVQRQYLLKGITKELRGSNGGHRRNRRGDLR